MNKSLSCLIFTAASLSAGFMDGAMLKSRLKKLAGAEEKIEQFGGIKVTGSSNISCKVNLIRFQLDMQFVANSLEEAKVVAHTQYNQLIEKIKSLGIADKNIETLNYAPRDLDQGEQKKENYHWMINTQIILNDREQIDQIVNFVKEFLKDNKAIAELLMNIHFAVTPDQQAQYLQEARNAAVEDAREDAQQLARAAGVGLANVLSIYETKKAYIEPYNMNFTLPKDEINMTNMLAELDRITASAYSAVEVIYDFSTDQVESKPSK